MIFELGGRVGERSNDKATPLHWAASNGHMETVEKLCALGADIMAVCSRDRTALRWAAINGHVDCLGRLVDLARQTQAFDAKSAGLGR